MMQSEVSKLPFLKFTLVSLIFSANNGPRWHREMRGEQSRAWCLGWSNICRS
ncbi:hypothetical protein SLEP1_g14877 [Rubroshorea leprosula]|uniref:Uncharacterized protein n=1 Tax=Rubroshorea leprosula TaxID=152421 RepID=A0AAV5IRN2_9ROSI|nr:hypothetical protein SLEP1_g14877 [Rubroshorea leprosula]